MKKTFYSFLLAGLMMLWAVPQLWGQSLPENITAFATAKAKTTGHGRVAISSNPETDTPDYDDEVTVDCYITGNTIQALADAGLWVQAYFYATPDDGYYFDHWVKEETGETFDQMPCVGEVFSAATTSNFDGTGVPYFYPLEETFKDSYPLIGTYKAVFKSVPVYSCTEGQLAYATANENKEWQVKFSTGFATSLDDFDEAEFTNATTGGTFTVVWLEASFADNVVTVPIEFTAAEVGTYTADLTLKSKGGASFTASVRVVVEAAAANDVLLKNGSSKERTISWADAMTQMVAGDTVLLLRDVTLDNNQTVSNSVTLDLNGRVLSGKMDVQANVTIIDSKMVGRMQSEGTTLTISSGSLTLKRGEIVGETAVSVKTGAAFNFVDGILTASQVGIDNNGGTVAMTSGDINLSDQGDVKGIHQMQSGILTITGGKINAVSTDNNAKGIELNGGTMTARNVTIKAAGTGSVAVDAAGGTVSLGQYAVLTATATGTGSAFALKDGGTVTIEGARLSAANDNGNQPEISNTISNTNSKVTVNYGYFVVDSWLNTYTKAEGQGIYKVSAGQAYTDGYRYFLGTSQNVKDNAVSICAIGTTAYGTLEEALLYAQNNPEEVLTILMVNDYTLPAGYYTLPANATLVVPASASQQAGMGSKVSRIFSAAPHSEYLRLTFATGANLDVFGTVETSGYQLCGDAFNPSFSATSSGAYGLIALNSGSTMTLENGATIYAWGFITGAGEIHARRGSQVREFFQVYDWPGALNAVTIYNNHASKKLFPLNQYFIQNVEAATVYHPGSRLYASFGAHANSLGGLTVAADNIQIVGLTGQNDAQDENAMYLMNPDDDADNTWVRKWYDVANDKQVYDVNSGAHLGSVVIALPMLKAFPQAGGMDSFDSKQFVLPLTTNMKIHLLTGAMDITQNTEMIPGTEIEVDKEATITINEGVSLYLYDTDQWDEYARNAYAQVVGFTPSWNGQPTARDVSSLEAIGDAKLNIHGTFNVEGRLLTTTSGANIFSTNADAGTVRFPNGAPASADDKLYQWKGGFSNPIATVPASLRNNAGQNPPFAETAGTEAGQSYCFINDRWTALYSFAEQYVAAGFEETVDDVKDSTFVYNNYGEWYIKPAAYVAVRTIQSDEYTALAGKPTTRPLENADHTYSDANGEGRLFIFLNNQWWEVTLENNLYRGTNGTYYYYDEDEEGWKEQKYTISFVNWNGAQIVNYDLSYGIMPAYNSTNPTREEDVDYTYTFTGWTPALAPVTGNTTYTATYKATQRKYTIVFLNENGTEIERHFLTRDEMPACDNLPTKTGYFLTWSPGIGAVTGNQTYQAVFTPEPPTKFTITFKNYNGAVLKQADKEADAIYTVEAGNLLIDVYDGSEPAKPATSEFTYTFTGWAPAITAETVATEDMTFTAQFSENRKQATVIFYKEDDETVLSSQTVDYGQYPDVPVYQKEAGAEYTYTMGWDPQVTAVSTTGTIKYTATVTPVKNRYTVTVNTAGCVAVGVGTYEYGTEVTLHLVASEGFEKARWSDGKSDDKTITVTGNVTLTASAQASSSSDNTLLVGCSDEPVVLDEETSVVAFTIEASAAGAGSLIHPELLQLKAGGTAYYRYLFNATARIWYAFSVPFECNAQTATGTSGNTLRLAYDYDIIRYNGATRAAHGTYGKNNSDNPAWEYLSDLGVNTLTPGVLYMIRFKHNQTSLTFTKKAGASIVYTTPVTLNTYNEQTNNDGKDANWNGVAMSNLYTSYMTTGTTYGQVYNGDGYTDVEMGTGNQAFQIGKPVFIQAASETTIIQSQSISTSAPVRRTAANSDEIQVALSQDGEQLCRVYVKADEDAEDRYVIGQDLAKMGVSSTKGQVWVNRYDARLLVNVTAPENEVAVFPLGISAPKAGAYTLSAPRGTGSATLYLMENGQVIANLTEGDYTLDLNKGTTEAYSLRMVLRPRGVVTDLDEAATIEGVQKVIKDGTLYIIRDGKAYTVQGQAVDAE